MANAESRQTVEKTKVLAETDLNQDGQPERIVLTKTGAAAIQDSGGANLYELQMPTKSDFMAGAKVYDIPGGLKLVHFYWPWCLRSYDDNLFVWYDPASGKFVADRALTSEKMRCGAYQYQGDGRFEVYFRNEEFGYEHSLLWQNDKFIQEGFRTELLYAEVDRLHDVLTALIEYDVYNPDALFAPSALYTEFKAHVGKGWRFQPATKVAADSLALEARLNDQTVDTLTVTYRVEGRFRSNILITGLRWGK